eukprot:UN10890
MRAPSSKRMISQWNHHCIKCHSTNGNPGLKGSNEFETEVAELGISCEACHGAAEEHVKYYQSPIARYAKHFGDKSKTAEHIKTLLNLIISFPVKYAANAMGFISIKMQKLEWSMLEMDRCIDW